MAHRQFRQKFVRDIGLNLAQRLHYKSVMAAEISTHDSEHRLLQLFDISIAYFNFKKDKIF